MIKTLLRLKYNMKERQELIENSLVTHILEYLIRNILDRYQNFCDHISFTKRSKGALF